MKNQRSSRISLLLLGLLAVACSKANDPVPSDTNSVPAQSLSEAQQIAETAVVHCSDPAQCSPSVGMLLATTKTQLYSCTAFLISDTVLATNGHCIPDDLKAAGSDCQDRIAVLFPEVGTNAAIRVGCAQVISASEIDSTFKNADYAFLKLAGSAGRPALSISHAGLRDGATYTVNKVDPYEGNGIPEGFLHRDTCRAVHGSLIDAAATTDQSPVMAIADCTIVEGNSGSPLTDAAGNVPGLVFARMKPESISNFLAKMSLQGMPSVDSSGSGQAPMGLATNYACLSTPTDASLALAPSCFDSVSPQSADLALSKAESAEMRNAIRDAQPKLAPELSWSTEIVQNKRVDRLGVMVGDQTAFVILPVPRCVTDEKSLLETETKGWFGKYAKTTDRSIAIPAWSVQLGLNRYLQKQYALSETPVSYEESFVMRYSPRTLVETGKTTVEIGQPADLKLGAPLYSGDLSLCK